MLAARMVDIFSYAYKAGATKNVAMRFYYAGAAL